jgi:hypothetical protein
MIVSRDGSSRPVRKSTRLTKNSNTSIATDPRGPARSPFWRSASS